MNLLMTGGSGLIGTRLTRLLAHNGYRVFRVIRPGGPRAIRTEARLRSAASSGGALRQAALQQPASETVNVEWDPARQGLQQALAEAFGGDVPAIHAVINLAGASIAKGRWTEARKQELRSSRIATTRRLVAGLAQLPSAPAAFLSASAIGYYGNRGDEILTEESAPGRDFLAKLARDWEAEALQAENWGARVMLMRFGIVLAREGGALPQIMRPFWVGAGGKLGSGRQWMSWVEIEDVACAVHFLLEHRDVRGPVNVVSPEPVTNVHFTKELAKAMRRPALLSIPAAALRLLLGREMAEALLLSNQRVVPKKLQDCGYQFLQPHLDAALHSILRG